MYIGVDLGGTNIATGIVNEEGKLIYDDSVPTGKERNYKVIVNDIIDLINKIIKESGIEKEKIKAVGIGIPGIAEANTGRVIKCPNLNWSNIPLKQIMEDRLNIPVFIDNDATLAALAEHTAGSMKYVSSGVFITIGTGIGGGVILDGKIESGFHGIGSEIGHMIVGKNYYNCGCGRNGCLETFASSTALISYTKRLIESGEKTVIIDKLRGNIEKLNGKLIFQAAKEGDPLANKAVNRMAKYLAVGIMNIVSIIDPEIFVLGGGISKAGDFLLNKIKEEVSRIKYYEGLPIGNIVLAKLGNEAGIIGAAILGKLNLEKERKI